MEPHCALDNFTQVGDRLESKKEGLSIKHRAGSTVIPSVNHLSAPGDLGDSNPLLKCRFSFLSRVSDHPC